MSKDAYLHGYSSPEQQRLLDQAAHWRDDLILPGTRFEPGTRLLELGCGVGAVLGVLGRAFPGLVLSGVDWEPRQLEAAQRHLGSLGLQAKLQQADAMDLPLPPHSFDEAWMMWFLEHLADPVGALRQARRVLKPGGGITCIEVDYHTLVVEPSTPALRALMQGFEQGMDAGGRSDSGAHLGAWMKEAGFERLDDRELAFDHSGPSLPKQVAYLLGFIEAAVPAIAALPGAPPLALLQSGVEDFRGVASHPQGRIRFRVHKARAFAP